MVAELTMDTRVCWDPMRLKEIDEAKSVIMPYLRGGYMLKKPDGSPITKWSPNLGEVIITARKISRHIMKILSDKGDERLTWDPDDGRQALEAKKKFTELLAKNYSAYSVDERGGKKFKIEEFDVDAAEILMIPPVTKG